MGAGDIVYVPGEEDKEEGGRGEAVVDGLPDRSRTYDLFCLVTEINLVDVDKVRLLGYFTPVDLVICCKS